MADLDSIQRALRIALTLIDQYNKPSRAAGGPVSDSQAQRVDEMRYGMAQRQLPPNVIPPEPRLGLSQKALSPEFLDTLDRLARQYRLMPNPVIGPDAEGSTRYVPASPFVRDRKPAVPTVRGF